MSERNRPLATPEELARSLIASARLDVQPAPEAVRDGILVSISTVGVLGSSAVASASLGALRRLGLVKWIAATAVLSTAGVGAYLGINRAPSSNAGRAREPEHAIPVARAPNPEASAMPELPVREAPESEASSPTLPAPRHRGAASKAGGPDKVSASDVLSLEGEVAALDRARSGLAAGNPLRTLKLLDGYEQAFPRGALRPEATYLRIQALSKSGQREAARALAARFLASHPKSPHAAQLQALLSP